jgi:hypothetical protein
MLTVRSYGPRLVRLYLVRENAEITCTAKELDALFAWACLTLGKSMAAPLPTREFTCARWGASYRWTLAAHRVYVADRAKRGVTT